MSAPIDLQPFCHPDRISIQEPFSIGGYSYATDGHILIRVPRRANVPDRPNPPNIERVWIEPAPDATPVRLQTAGLPDPETGECEQCDGRGMGCQCVNCGCPCVHCDGKGVTEKDQWVLLFGARITLRTARLLATLPNIYAAPVSMGVQNVNLGRRVWVKFDGGEGQLATAIATIHHDVVANLTPHYVP